MSVLERLIKARLQTEGVENITGHPTLFAVNHFTRAETFIVPYVVHKHTDRYIRGLADAGLFKGRFGDYLRDMGVVSTKEPERDRLIIGDLMTGRHDWMIYPEGVMVKSKKVFKHGKCVITTPNRIGPPHTGAAMLALKAEIYKREYCEALSSGDMERIEQLRERFDIDDGLDVCSLSTVVVPVTISYYPLRPGQNLIKKLAGKFFKELPERLEEELAVEGNILMRRTDVNINFGKPIFVADYLRKFYMVGKIMPFWRTIETNNLVLKRQATKLTRVFMKTIYTNLQVNIDHLFCAGLRVSQRNQIPLSRFKQALFCTTARLRVRGRVRLHQTLNDDVVNLAISESIPAFDDVVQLADRNRIISALDDDLLINRLRFNMMHMFHNVRVRNPCIVIANEVEPLRDVIRGLKDNVNAAPDVLAKRVAESAIDVDRWYFEHDRAAFHDETSCASAVCTPFLLTPTGYDSGVGVVLTHGFLAAPGEIRPLAEYLCKQGCTVYGVRLRGHGTTPDDLAGREWGEWYRSLLRGYAVVRQYCSRVVLGGFSTGGVLSLLAAAKRENDIAGVFAVNSPVRLKYINARRGPAVHFYNTLLDALNLGGGIRFVDSSPEFPDTNFKRIPVAGLAQLGQLMDTCWQQLKYVKAPTYLLHANDDPIVQVESSRRIYGRIRATDKQLDTVERGRHVIVRGDGCEDIFERLNRFVRRIAFGPETVDAVATCLNVDPANRVSTTDTSAGPDALQSATAGI